MKEIDFRMLKELANILKSCVYEVRIDTQVCRLEMSTFSQIANMYRAWNVGKGLLNTSGDTRVSQFLPSEDIQTNLTTQQEDVRSSVLYFFY